jgi:hypothetical protein
MADTDTTAEKPRQGRTQGKGGLKLGSPEWVQMMKDKKAAKIAAGDTNAKGGTGPKPTKQEARDRELEKLVPSAIKVLKSQMQGEPCACPHCGETIDIPDFKLQQSAAVRVLEWGKGKPRQTVEQVGETVQVIRYESAALGSTN